MMLYTNNQFVHVLFKETYAIELAGYVLLLLFAGLTIDYHMLTQPNRLLFLLMVSNHSHEGIMWAAQNHENGVHSISYVS